MHKNQNSTKLSSGFTTLSQIRFFHVKVNIYKMFIHHTKQNIFWSSRFVSYRYRNIYISWRQSRYFTIDEGMNCDSVDYSTVSALGGRKNVWLIDRYNINPIDMIISH